MFKPKLWIFHVNRFDLTQIAYRSVEGWFDIQIINNGDKQEQALLKTLGCNIYRPPIPFNFRQSQQLILTFAIEQNLPSYFWMHNDVEALEGTPEKLIKFVCNLREPWGVVLTDWDCMTAFNTKALEAIGGWSDLFGQYFLDNHTYRLLEQNGYPLLRSNLQVIHHEDASCTLKADSRRIKRNEYVYPIQAFLYQRIWNGSPGQEKRQEPVIR